MILAAEAELCSTWPLSLIQFVIFLKIPLCESYTGVSHNFLFFWW